MPTYTVQVFTGYSLADNADNINVKLVGENGESDWSRFTGLRSSTPTETTLKQTCQKSLGELVSVQLQKQWRLWPLLWPLLLPPLMLPLLWRSLLPLLFTLLLPLLWPSLLPLLFTLLLTLLQRFQQHKFVEKVEVTSPDRKVFKIPINHWIKRTKVYSFCEGKALRAWEQHDDSEKCLYTRKEELERRKEKYRWRVYKEGLPECIDADEVSALPSEVQFSYEKMIHFYWTAVLEWVKTKMTELYNWFWSKNAWESFDDIKQALSDCATSPVSEYVKQNWKEDAFFGYQFLNGVNPMMIRRCDSLPRNFPVTDDMVKLEGKRKLSEEMKNGNMFLCDYKDLDGVTTSHINNEEQYLAAPLVLFHKTPADELKPVAIQLKQTPAEDNPIFVSSDSEYDWLLAKIFVRSADFNEHQMNAHLLRTHLLAEVFTVALLRNLPKVHPLYKLLIPHTRFTLHINVSARQRLISENGVFTSFSAASVEGMTKLMRRSRSAVTYKSLCIKDDIKERGLESVPNFYYRDDGFKLWDVIEKFVKGVLTYYYKKDQEIKRDTELQEYIKSIFKHGFGSREETGIPQRFETVDELVKFVTMVIFSCSAQHAAVNNGQADYGSWMPNTPTSLQNPPPTEKGSATEETVLQTLPDRNTTLNAVSVVKLLSTQSSDFVALGHFPHDHFTEEEPIRLMEEFRAELNKLDEEIDDKNNKRKLPYMYLKPSLMENSVSI